MGALNSLASLGLNLALQQKAQAAEDKQLRQERNRQLEAIVMSALDRHQRPLYLGLDVGIDGGASTNEHIEIANAVGAHDMDKARKLMVKHIAKAEDRIVAALRAAGY